MRILTVAEDLSPPIDEGMKKTAWNVIRAWEGGHQVVCITRSQPAEARPNFRVIPLDKFFRHPRLGRIIRESRPEVVFYFPEASATRNSFWRAHRLRRLAGVPVCMVGLQPRHYGILDCFVVRRWAPDVLAVLSSSYAARLETLCRSVETLPPGVDLERFRPAAIDRKQELRERLLRGWPPPPSPLPPAGGTSGCAGVRAHRPIALHVGHIKPNRNLGDLLALARSGRARVVMVGSTSTRVDDGVRRDLEQAGVMVVAEYVPAIEEIYQAADVYVFPVVETDAAMDVPLSILEAMACNLPVVTRKFGGIEDWLPESADFKYYGDPGQLPDLVEELLAGETHTCLSAEQFSWSRMAERLLEVVARSGSPIPEESANGHV